MAYSGPSEIDPAHILFNPHTDKIGEGKFGSVYRGRCHECVVAIKIPKRQSLSARDLEKFRREVNIMSRINHPNVCLFMGACTLPERIYIVTELLKCDLEKVLKSPEPIALSVRMKWAKDAATGMAWLHGNNPAVLHRDLKTSNLLIGDNDVVKVCDFGLSQFQQEGSSLRDSSPKGYPLYMAPEVIMQREITPKVDVYAFGIIVWEILTRTEAFSHHNDINRFAQAICRHRERPPIPTDTPDSLRQLMLECWDHDPNIRPTFADLVPRLEAISFECERLEALMRIDHKIQDLNGRILWKENFLALNGVPWEQFIRTLCFLIQFPLPDDLSRPTDTTRPIFALKTLLLDRDSEEVTLQQFGKVLGWFGPLEPLHSEGAFLDRVADLLAHDWFHGALRTESAEALLVTQPPGTYLFRFSSMANCFALSHVSSGNVVQHHLIQHVPGSGFELHGRVFDSLQSLVVQEARRYGLADHVRCTTYTWIFNTGSAQTVIGYQASLVR